MAGLRCSWRVRWAGQSASRCCWTTAQRSTQLTTVRFFGRCWVLDSLVPAPSWFNGCPQGCSSRPLCVPPAAAGQGCRSQQGFPRRGGRALDAPPCGRTKQPHPMRPALARARGTDQRCNQTYNPASDPPFVIYLAGQRGSRHCASRSRTAGSSASSC